jgi:outer membrane receptor protein involved in Fe transport
MVGLLRILGALGTVFLFGAIAWGQPSPAVKSLDAALLGDLPVVEAASLHTQTLEEAPANVTIIGEDEIRRFGYRTLGEALSSVRGFYVTNDRSYRYVGVRGFSLPGDYNTRFLVMLNGHSLTENVYGSNNYFGQDFGLDMDLVKRIEIIRGPSSALYGSNGMFATVNIITKSPVEGELARASAEVDSFGERKAIVSTSLNLGQGANLLISGSVFNNSGQSFYFPEFAGSDSGSGWARGVDGERGYHTFTNLVWRNWSFIGFFNSREKNYPTPSYGVIFGDRGNKILDRRDFMEASWSRTVGADGTLRWRVYYDDHEYRGRYDMPLDDTIQDNRDLSQGNWVGTQITYRFDLPRRSGSLTLGSELNADIRTLQQNLDMQPSRRLFLDLNDPDLSFAAFLQHEWQFRPAWTLNLGLRFDESRNHGHFVAPRLALVYQRSPKTVYKLVAGVAFRDPTAFEEFYDDKGASQLSNAGLRPENIQTLEGSIERKLSKRVSAVVCVYHYRLSNLIEAVPVGDGIIQYQNVARYRGQGAEVEFKGSAWKGLEATASVALVDLDRGNTADSWPANSPNVVGKILVAAPLDRGRFTVAGAFESMSRRRTFGYDIVGPAYLTNLTVTSARLHPDFDVQVGIRNLFDQRAWDPASPGQGLDVLARDGRSAFVKLIWHTRR